MGVTSSQKMLLEPKGLSLDSWQDQFSTSSSAADMQAFTDAMRDVDSDAVVFDCTASDVPGQFYPQWMGQGVHIITPNKKLHSGPLREYQSVRDLQAQGKAHYFYEVSSASFVTFYHCHRCAVHATIKEGLPECVMFQWNGLTSAPT